MINVAGLEPEPAAGSTENLLHPYHRILKGLRHFESNRPFWRRVEERGAWVKGLKEAVTLPEIPTLPATEGNPEDYQSILRRLSVYYPQERVNGRPLYRGRQA